jgi:hypothetical protein
MRVKVDVPRRDVKVNGGDLMEERQPFSDINGN